MKRNINILTDVKFDLLIIGGGIHGAVMLWQAALAGLSVALIEKQDFGHATSANSQKIIHGGIRYLQNFDFVRTRQSLIERRRMMYLAPHLVHPLPCLMPLYGHGLKGKQTMSLGLKIYDLIGIDRNKGSDPSKFIPDGRILSTSEICELVPGIDPTGLKGAAKWHDACCYNTERLVLAFVKSACRLGGVASNYVKAKNLLPQKDSGIIIKAHDKINDEHIEIFAKNVINCCGPWIYDLVGASSNESKREKINYAVGINVITKKLFPHEMAVGLRNHIDRKARLYFVTPWRGKSIIGTEWFESDAHPDKLMADENQCQQLINGFNEAYQPASLTLGDVDHVHVGLVPCKKEATKNQKNVNLLNHFRLIDHSKEGLYRVISSIGIKYTTAVSVGEKTIRYIYPNINATSILSLPRLIGGEIDNYSTFQDEIKRKLQLRGMDENNLTQLILNYGREAENIIKLGSIDNSDHTKDDHSVCDILRGQTLFAVRAEMAQKLSDVVLRRTQLGTLGCPSDSSIEKVSILMAAELGWDETKRKSEINQVKNYYPLFLSSKTIETQREPVPISGH